MLQTWTCAQWDEDGSRMDDVLIWLGEQDRTLFGCSMGVLGSGKRFFGLGVVPACGRCSSIGGGSIDQGGQLPYRYLSSDLYSDP